MKEIISPVDTEDGLFHDGDPSTGTEGTVVSQKWLNPVQGAVISSQQEMAAVLKEAGIKIDPSKQDQLLAAIKKITGTATEGYLKVGDYGFGGGPQHKTEAYSKVAQIYRINNTSESTPGSSVYGVICLPCDGAPSASYLAAGNNGELHVGRSTTPSNGVIWNRVYTTAYKPTAADMNAADVRNNFAARMGVSRVLTGANKPTSPGVWNVENCTWTPATWGTLYVTTGNSDLSTTPANGKYIHYLFIAHGTGNKLFIATDVNGTFSGWYPFVSANGGTFTGAIGSSYSDTYRIVSGQYGTFWRNDGKALYLMLTNAGDQWGTFNNLRPFAVSTSDGSINVGTSFSVNFTGYINKLGVNPYTSNGQNFNQTNGLHIQGAGDQYGDIYYLETVGKYGSLSFHIHGGGLDAYPAFNNNGSLSLNGSWPAITNSSGTTWHPDGNVEGPQWGGYLSNWLNKNISNAQNNAQNWAYQNLVQNVRLTGRINQPDTGGQVRIPDGCVFTGMSGANYDPSIWGAYSYVQVLINGSWRNIGTS